MNIVLSSSHSSLSAEHESSEHESHDEHGGEQSRIEHIIRELITTEEIYIRELVEVLNGYGKEIDSIPPNKNCPEILRGNRYDFSFFQHLVPQRSIIYGPYVHWYKSGRYLHRKIVEFRLSKRLDPKH